MSDLIRIKGGSGNVPQLQEREIAYSKDEKSLYIGTANGNVKLCTADDVLRLIQYENRIAELENKSVGFVTTAELDEVKARLDALGG